MGSTAATITMNNILLLALVTTMATAGPTVYKIDQEEGTAERVMTPVSSTVIPLEDLPELQVGYGFGLVDKNKVPKPFPQGRPTDHLGQQAQVHRPWWGEAAH